MSVHLRGKPISHSTQSGLDVYKRQDAYVYGYELLISSVVSVLFVVLIAVVCGDVPVSYTHLRTLQKSTHDK